MLGQITNRVTFRVLLHLPLLKRGNTFDGSEGTTIGCFDTDPGLQKGDSLYIANYQPFPDDEPISFEAIVTKRGGTLIWDEDYEKCVFETRILLDGSEKRITEKIAKLFADNKSEEFFID